MSDCDCGEWGRDGVCVKCGHHYTDRWDELQAENAALRLALSDAMEWNWLDDHAPDRTKYDDLIGEAKT